MSIQEFKELNILNFSLFQNDCQFNPCVAQKRIYTMGYHRRMPSLSSFSQISLKWFMKLTIWACQASLSPKNPGFNLL